jgi:signal transduction histidine kinase
MVIGGGLTLGVWLFVGVFFGRRIAAIEAQADVVSERYLEAQQLLLEARNQVLLSAVALRETLLDSEEPFRSDGRRRMLTALGVAEQNLERYVPIFDEADERERIANLRSAIGGVRREMLSVLEAERSLSPAEIGTLLRGTVMQRRESATRIAEEFGTLNRLAFVRYQSDVIEIYRETQNQVWRALGFAVVASLAIALGAGIYIGRLEGRVAEQHERDRALRRDLQRLSSALIKAREDERRSIARELHDEIGQLMTAAKVTLAAVRRAVAMDGPVRRSLDEATDIVDRALHGVRDLTRLLHPTVLEDLGLVAAVDLLVKEFRKRDGADIVLLHEHCQGRLRPDVETAAYRIVQEGLTNVAKHARARHCVVRLLGHDGKLVVEVDDDGVGFAGEAAAAEGLGLVSMRERAAQLGGSMEILSGSGRGTRITVVLPLQPEPVAELAEGIAYGAVEDPVG